MDKKGLLVNKRDDSDIVEEYKIQFLTKSHELCPDLKSAVESIKPTILIGCSFTKLAPFKFTKEIIQSIASNTERPIIFPLSPCEPECTIYECMEWTNGRALISTYEGDNSVITLPNGKSFSPRQCHTTYVFPGIVLGLLMSRYYYILFIFNIILFN